MDSHKQQPFVSVLLVTRNEAQYVRRALMSLINQTYPSDRYEIIVVDGLSDDGTIDIINGVKDSAVAKGIDIRIFCNPKRILASGWNIGIKNAYGKYVVRIDAHAEAFPNFLEKSVEAMQLIDATCVGGKLITQNLNGTNSIVSKVLSSPFGVGNSSFRVSDKEGYVDTAVYGLYKKEIFEQVGFLDENFVRNQDIELHRRIHNAGGRFYFYPKICCKYYARHSVKKMLQQAFNNGKWNMVLLKKDYHALSARHLIPFVFVLYLILSSIIGIIWHPIWYFMLAVLILHVSIGICAAIRKTHMVHEIFLMPILFLLLHLAYGSGYFWGLLVKIER